MLSMVSFSETIWVNKFLWIRAVLITTIWIGMGLDYGEDFSFAGYLTTHAHGLAVPDFLVYDLQNLPPRLQRSVHDYPPPLALAKVKAAYRRESSSQDLGLFFSFCLSSGFYPRTPYIDQAGPAG